MLYFPCPSAAIRYFFKKPSFPLGGEWILGNNSWTLRNVFIAKLMVLFPDLVSEQKSGIQHHGVHSGFLLSFPSCTCFFWWWETRLPFTYLPTWSLPLSVIVSFRCHPFPLWASFLSHLNSTLGTEHLYLLTDNHLGHWSSPIDSSADV